MVEDLSETQVIEVSAVVLPELLHFVGAQDCPPALQRQALSIFKSTIEALELVYNQHPGARELLSRILGPWLRAISGVLSIPVMDCSAVPFWEVQYEALGCLTKLIPPFAKVAGDHLHPVMASTWGMMTSLLPLYEKVMVAGDGEVGPAADDATHLPDLVSQLLEAVLTMVGSHRLVSLMCPTFPELLYLTLGYMQMSEEEESRWSGDVNAYLGDEDELWGARATGEILVDEIMERGGASAATALADAVRRRTQEAAAARAGGSEGLWWRTREAVLLGVGAAAGRIVIMKKKGKPLPPELDPDIATARLLAEDLGGSGDIPPFLAGRALWLLARWSSVLQPATKMAALNAAAAALAAPGSPAPAQAGACQALCKLCRGASPQDLQVASETALGGLCALLSAATDDSLHLVLETLTALVKANPGGVACWGSQLTPAALKAWVENVSDPLVGIDAFDLLQALANVPECLPALYSRALPVLLDVVAHPTPHSPILVSGCLDVMVALLVPSAPELAQKLCSAAVPPVLALVASSDDEEITASASSFLRTMLQVGKENALGWTGLGQDPAVAAGILLQVIERLLRPELHDRACRNVGSLILELLRHACPLVV